MTSNRNANANFPTGTNGLVVVDKTDNRFLFLDVKTYETVPVLDGFAPGIHELAISPDHRRALCPIYGDGRHGANPNPGHLIAVFDLVERRHVGDFSTAPYVAPHGLRWGPKGQLYCNCENSGVILQMDAETGAHVATIEIGSNKAHRIEVLPDGSKLHTENEEDASACVIDLATRRRVKKITTANGLAGLGMSPDGSASFLLMTWTCNCCCSTRRSTKSSDQSTWKVIRRALRSRDTAPTASLAW
jgi:DNA-binding beta-propeller fold protein YncE